MIARKIRAYVEIPISPTDMEHSIRYAMTIINISLSGCFIKMDQGLEVGVHISFSLPLQGGKTLHLLGSIAREQETPHGYGIIFNPMTEEERRELALLIADSDELPNAVVTSPQ
jgi:PilZ domain